MFQVKSAFTRTYNKSGHLHSYATDVGAKKGRGRGAAADQLEDLDGETGEDNIIESEEEEEKLDGMIKVLIEMAIVILLKLRKNSQL